MNPTQEEWRPVRGYEGLYEVSDLGRIRSLARTVLYRDGRTRTQPDRMMSPGATGAGHLAVGLTRNGVRSFHKVHHLVAEAFIGPRGAGVWVLHYDDDPTNNRVENLRYGSREDNAKDRQRNRGYENSLKTHCPRGHVYGGANLRIVRGMRHCVACTRARSYLWKYAGTDTSFEALADEKYTIITGTRPEETP